MDAMWQLKPVINGTELQSLIFLIPVLCSSWRALKSFCSLLSLSLTPSLATHEHLEGTLWSHSPLHSLWSPAAFTMPSVASPFVY